MALSHMVDVAVDSVFGALVKHVGDYKDKDRILAGQGAAVLLAQLLTWLVAFELGYAVIAMALCT